MLADTWAAAMPSDIPVLLGGPAYGDKGGEFVPGRYLALGNVITSRGCPNRCSYCLAAEREGSLREIEIQEGWRVHDNNLLATSDAHFAAVCAMLSRQPKRAILAGGLEARRLTPARAELLRQARVDRLYFANDRRGDLDHLKKARQILEDVGFTRNHLYCYVLIGQAGDSVADAESRLQATWDAGYMPYAMLYRGIDNAPRSTEWKQFQRIWLRPAIIRRIQNQKGISK